MTRHSSDLESSGFERLGQVSVALPHFVWKIDIDLEFDRDVRLVEETVLGLVAAGVGSPDRIAELMGLDDGRIVTTAVVELLRRGSLGHREDSLTISQAGQEILRTTRSRDVRRHEDIELRHDPYRNELKWAFGEPELKKEAVEAAGVHALPAPSAMSSTKLEARHGDVQALLEREGLPRDSPDDRKFNEKRRREVVRISAIKHYVAYREATLEVWQHPARKECQWRLVGGASEDAEVTAQMASLESEGQAIVPLHMLDKWELGPKGLQLRALGDSLERVASSRLEDSSQLSVAQCEAIESAERRLTVVAPWLPDAPVDSEMLDALVLALETNQHLQATVACCSVSKAGQVPKVIRQQQEACLANLKALTRRNGRLRLVEIGTAMDSLLIVDDRHAVLARVELVPFEPKPGQGLLQDRAFRIEEAAAITDARILIDKLLAG